MFGLEDVVKRLLGKGSHRQWSPDKYRRFVEEVDDAVFQEYRNRELELISQVQHLSSRDVLDLGSGYGRIAQNTYLLPRARTIVLIDNNNAMLRAARKRAVSINSVSVIESTFLGKKVIVMKHDITRPYPPFLTSIGITMFSIQNPVLVCLQNTLGTLDGEPGLAVYRMRKMGAEREADIILSLFCQESLSSYGVELYRKLMPMVGEIDLNKCDFNSGLFVSKTGYTSKWWTPEEREEFKNLLMGQSGRVIREVNTMPYYILHITHKKS